MARVVRGCDPEILPQLLSMVDAEFIYNKGRHLSFGDRFPNVFSHTNLKNIHVVQVDNQIGAAGAARRFRWFVSGRVWKGAMIGSVCTAPRFRGQGLGSMVMRSLTEHLVNGGEDFAVLWTNIPGFYERLGWSVQDRSCFGEATRALERESFNLIFPDPLTERSAQRCERIREAWLSHRVLRSMIDYRTTPLPVDRVQCFSDPSSGGSKGYALVGEVGNGGYVYEMIGDPSVFGSIWASLLRRYSRLYINDQSESTARAWLDDRGYVTWRSQRSAMWLKLSPHVDDLPIGQWYIPYFDRI